MSCCFFAEAEEIEQGQGTLLGWRPRKSRFLLLKRVGSLFSYFTADIILPTNIDNNLFVQTGISPKFPVFLGKNVYLRMQLCWWQTHLQMKDRPISLHEASQKVVLGTAQIHSLQFQRLLSAVDPWWYPYLQSLRKWSGERHYLPPLLQALSACTCKSLLRECIIDSKMRFKLLKIQRSCLG